MTKTRSTWLPTFIFQKISTLFACLRGGLSGPCVCVREREREREMHKKVTKNALILLAGCFCTLLLRKNYDRSRTQEQEKGNPCSLHVNFRSGGREKERCEEQQQQQLRKSHLSLSATHRQYSWKFFFLFPTRRHGKREKVFFLFCCCGFVVVE